MQCMINIITGTQTAEWFLVAGWGTVRKNVWKKFLQDQENWFR